MESFTKGMYKFGEVILYAFMSMVYSGLILLPIFLISLMLDGPIGSYVLLFIPLVGLLGFALERQAISFTESFVYDKKAFVTYFKETFDSNTLSKYGLYTILFALYYYANQSLFIIGEASAIFGILTIILNYFYRGIIFYSILQTALREYVGIIPTIRNALILTYKYFAFSLVVFVVFEIFQRLMAANILWIFVFIIIFAAMINMVNEYAIKNL